MGKYNFDEIIERKGTNALKHDFAAERGKPKDVLPLWVADMDFKTAPCIIERLQEDLNNGIFGYTESKEDYFLAVQKWMKESYSWDVKEEWLVKTPGIVFALAMAVKAFTNEGDSVMIQTPVYYPFTEVIIENSRNVVDNTLILNNGVYEIDYADMEEKIIQYKVKLFLFCSPHNPVGRVWTKTELDIIGELCKKHHVLVVSDEIHADFVFGENKHRVYASISESVADSSIICTSPTKTFNIAGFQIANIFISNKEIRDKFLLEKSKAGFSQVSMSGISACQAAYENGREWYEELKCYLKENLMFATEFLSTYLPKVRLIKPQGTYLLWLDFRAYGYEEEILNHKIIEEAKLWLDAGDIFGPSGKGFQRLNMACPRDVLKIALERLKKVFSE